MMRYAICNELFQGWSFDSVCDFVGGLGYSGLEVAPFTLAEDIRTLTPTVAQTCAAAAARAGIAIVGLHWLLVSPKGLSLTAPEVALRKTTSDYLCSLVDLCTD